MFEEFSELHNIIVTGCQRSGTRILSKMIAHDTGHLYVDETEYHIHNESKLFNILQGGFKFVVHAPNWLNMRVLPDMLAGAINVVHINRDRYDILKSMARINWFPRAIPLLQNLGIPNPQLWHTKAYPDLVEARWKYDLCNKAWSREVYYDNLKDHPLWIDPEKRTQFQWDQTEIKSEEPQDEPE